ncbi:NEDD4-binding protein 2-like 1 [Araneus ventricosus]|uniref:NEDD4-binding protein 2-like 1 n=1 Tax=Araneus ventricosus TaxID=182803 RepID=A0A4Y2S7Z0_ARAVE|nr:NEDD4-binding protein 2-like 1 [Araneus ventricosus]
MKSRGRNKFVDIPADTPMASQTRTSICYYNTEEVEKVFQKIKMGCRLLIVLRGLPGSGKSTLAKKLKSSGVVCSTDDYFYKNGKYLFDVSLLKSAHLWNQERTRDLVSKNVTPVIIDNTNTKAWEMLPYVKMGKDFDYEVIILEPDTPWKFQPQELAIRNKHNVCKEKIEKMLAQYEHNITLDSIYTPSENKTYSENASGASLSSRIKEETSFKLPLHQNFMKDLEEGFGPLNGKNAEIYSCLFF